MFIKGKRSQRKTLKSIGPNMEPCSTPCSVFVHLLNVLLRTQITLSIKMQLNFSNFFCQIHKYEVLLSEENGKNIQMLFPNLVARLHIHCSCLNFFYFSIIQVNSVVHYDLSQTAQIFRKD